MNLKHPEDNRKLWAVAGLAVIVLCILNLKNVPGAYVTAFFGALRPILTALVMALALNAPLQLLRQGLERLDRKGILSEGVREGIAIAVVLLVVVAFLYTAVTVIVPQVIRMLERLANYLLNGDDGLQEQVRKILRISPETWKSTVQSWVNQLSSTAAGYLQQGVSSLISITTGAVNLMLSLTMAFYMIAARKTLKRQFYRLTDALLPEPRAALVRRTFELAGSTLSRWIGRQMLEGMIFSAALATVMLILNLPYIVPVAFVTLCLYMIPYIGSWTSFAMGFVLMLSVNLHTAIVFGIALIVLQTLDGNILNPHLVGTSVGLPPWLSLSAVCFFGALFGIGGMFLGVPVCAVLYALLKEFIVSREKKKAALRAESGREAPEKEKEGEISHGEQE